jgi:hypothetical protein
MWGSLALTNRRYSFWLRLLLTAITFLILSQVLVILLPLFIGEDVSLNELMRYVFSSIPSNGFQWFLDVVFIIILILSVYLASRSKMYDIIERLFYQRDAARERSQLELEGVQALIRDIEGRVSRLQARSNLILVVIISALVSGLILIIFAGRLTTIDAESASNMSLLEDEISKVDSEISSINNKEGQLLHPQKSSSSDPVPVALTVDDIGIKSLEAEKNVLNERRENGVTALKTTWDTEANVTNHDKLKDTSYVTATFLTRIGILAILVFLVQILISLYKYNTRIVAFYVSRLDSLRISEGKVDEFRSLIELMTPINVDFGRDPRHPVEVLL